MKQGSYYQLTDGLESVPDIKRAEDGIIGKNLPRPALLIENMNLEEDSHALNR